MSTTKNPDERIVIYLDNSNIFNGFKKYKIKADYEKLKIVMSQGRNLVKIILYEGVFYPVNPNKLKWYNDLKNISNYEIETSFDKRTSSEVIEKKIDVKIAIDMVSDAYENVYDTAVLVSGDGDFLPVVQKLKKIGKEVELWAFNYSLANVLKEEIEPNRLYYIEDDLEKIQI